MNRNFKLFAAFFALLLSMCTIYDQSGAIIAPNGLSCQNFTNYESFEGQPAAECYYSCPDGTGRQVEIKEEFSSSSPLYKASKEELNERFCEDPSLPVLTEPAGPDSPPAVVETTEEPSPTPTATRRPTMTPWRKPYLTVTLTERPRNTQIPPTRERQPTDPPPQPTNPPPTAVKTNPPDTPVPPPPPTDPPTEPPAATAPPAVP